MGTETELKLRLDPAGLLGIKRHPLIRRMKMGRAVTEVQKSVYFDTRDLALRRALVALRVRHIGPRRIQTVKTYGRMEGGAWTRGEWEVEIAGDTPDLEAIAAPEVASMFADRNLMRTLAPVFTTEVRRTILHLKDESGEIELALDEGAVTARNGAEAICEAELELISGDPASLFRVAADLQADIPLRLCTRSKADRGYALVEGDRSKAVRAGIVEMKADCPARDAFRLIAWSCLAQILGNQEILEREADPEAVHQMRVGLRRLRSAMSLFREILAGPGWNAIRKELRWLQGHLGPARDIDVFIAEILDPLAPLAAEEDGLAALVQDFDTERRASYDIARQVLSLPRYTRLMLGLGLWLTGGDWLSPPEEADRTRLNRPVRGLAVEILKRHDRKVRKGLHHLGTLDAHTRHLGRIEVKKLRYAAEFFAALFPAAKTKKAMSALGKLQDGLGLLNDIATARATLRQKAEESGDPARMWAAGMVAGWHSARISPLLDEAIEDLERYKRAAREWIEALRLAASRPGTRAAGSSPEQNGGA